MTNKQTLAFFDKLLPNQREYSKLYTGHSPVEQALFESICRIGNIPRRYEDLQLEESDKVTMEEVGSNPAGLRLLSFLLVVSRARTVLEIGTFLGASAIHFARALPADGKVVTIEKFDHFAAIARRNIERNGLSGKIDVIEGDAIAAVDLLPDGQTFDLIFIDGDKGRYKDYFIKTERLLSPHGISVVDDCFFHGDALNAHPQTEKGQGVKNCLDYLAGRDDLIKVPLPISNGILLITRRR